ncbi:MAG: hypothetical protein ACOCRK_10520 [bacterium]
MLSRWVYILIGDNDTGKTTFQKEILNILCSEKRNKLNCNVIFPITYPHAKGKLENLFLMSRSYKEKEDLGDYKSVSDYFNNHFVKDSSNDVIILSSRFNNSHLKLMIEECHKRIYNVSGVFFSNSFNVNNSSVSLLNWDERLWFENPIVVKNSNEWEKQIKNIAIEFVKMIVNRVDIQ